MVRGAQAKQFVTDKIMETFQGAFIYGKELRIPMEEDGQRIEIKVALTCAKTNVGGDGDSVKSGSEAPADVELPWDQPKAEPTAEEKQNIADLMNRLGL